jgi:UDP-2,3-diacylglucosamine pyrophosphatase LpxH
MEEYAMKIREDFVRANPRVTIISGNGTPTPIPAGWQPVFKSCHILVVIPDMHMYLYDSNLDNFKYGASAMLHFLDHLMQVKGDLADGNKTLRIYQLGDFYELRFPGRDNPDRNATAEEILLSDPSYDEIVNTMKYLHTHFIYGNHDFELRHFPSMSFGALEGKVYMEHGFTPSPWYEDPNKPLWDLAMLTFLKERELESFWAKFKVAVGLIRKDEHMAVGVTSGEIERPDYPPEGDYPAEEKDYYIKHLTNGVDNARICVIGHTHHPYLDANVSSGNYIYVDAGAWTEGRSNFVVVTDEEIALCHYKR